MIADRVRQTSGKGLPQGAVALLHFDNNFNDVVQGLAWTPMGNAGFAEGKFAEALSTYGTGGYVRSNFTDSIDFAKRNFTISFWINTNDLYSYCIVNKTNLISSPDQTFRSFLLMQTNGDGNLTFFVWGGIDTNGTINYGVSSSGGGPNKIVIGQKSYVKFGRKGANIFIVLDGKKVTAAIDPNFKINTTSQYLTFGGAISGSNDGFKGSIDELLIQMDIGDDSLDIPTAPY